MALEVFLGQCLWEKTSKKSEELYEVLIDMGHPHGPPAMYEIRSVYKPERIRKKNKIRVSMKR
jgi:hypothetical protein